MADLNVVALTGTIAKPPELISKGELKVARLRIAVEGRRRNRRSGELEAKPNFFNVAVFGSPAEEAAALGSQTRVAISGQLSWSRYTDREGVEREGVEIITREWVRALNVHQGEGAGVTRKEAGADHDHEAPEEREEREKELPLLQW